MTLSNGIAYTTVVIGFILLAVTGGLAGCGGAALSKLNEAVASIGLWGVYFIIPAILSLVAGFGGYRTVFAIALTTHILGILVALGGLSYASVVWAILDSTCTNSMTRTGRCSCELSSEMHTYDASCSTLTTVRDLNAAATILYALSLFVCLIGSILGCAGVCCRQSNYRRQTVAHPYVLPYNPGGMMMTSLDERRYRGEPGRYPGGAIYPHGPYVEERPYIHDKGRHRAFIEDRPYILDIVHYGPHIEERPYIRAKPYHHGPYAEERRYTHDNPYDHPTPLKPPTHRLDPLFAGSTNEVTDDERGLHWVR